MDQIQQRKYTSYLPMHALSGVALINVPVQEGRRGRGQEWMTRSGAAE